MNYRIMNTITQELSIENGTQASFKIPVEIAKEYLQGNGYIIFNNKRKPQVSDLFAQNIAGITSLEAAFNETIDLEKNPLQAITNLINQYTTL